MIVYGSNSFSQLTLINTESWRNWPYCYLISENGSIIATGAADELKIWCDMNFISIKETKL